MSIGTVGSSNTVATQKTTAVDESRATDATATEAKKATPPPDAAATVQATQEVQDAARQVLKSVEGVVRQTLEQGWDEARARTRGGRGGQTRADASQVTRGLTQLA